MKSGILYLGERNLIVSRRIGSLVHNRLLLRPKAKLLPHHFQLSSCSNQLVFQHLASVGKKPRSLRWSSLQVAELHDSSAVEPIASVVLAGTSDWVSVESSSAV